MSRASVYLPVTSNRPRSDINVSLPHDLMYPVEKCGRPAASVGDDDGGDSDDDSGGSGAETQSAVCMMEPSDNSLIRSEPWLTNGDMSE